MTEEIHNLKGLLTINKISKDLKNVDEELLLKLKTYLFDKYTKADLSDKDFGFLKAAFDRVSALLYLIDTYKQTERYFKK